MKARSPLQQRLLVSRAVRARRRNQLSRRPLAAEIAALPEAPIESITEAVAALEAQFPWLRSAERQSSGDGQKA